MGDVMKRLSGPWVVLAVLLAALLPIEQAHCLWMPAPARTTAAAAAATCTGSTHACCAPAPSSRSSHRSPPTECPCIQLPQGALPSAATVPSPSLSALAIVPMAWALAAFVAVPAPVPAPDVGGPPLPIACDAHGMRAPPLSV
jgi:hypothetical protein